MPERTPLKGRGVHSAYVYVGAGLFVASVLVVGTIPALLVEGGGTGGGGEVWPTYTDTGAPPSPDDVFYEGSVYLEPSEGVDLDRTTPGPGSEESADVVLRVHGDATYLDRSPAGLLAKAPPGMVTSPSRCATVLARADGVPISVPVDRDDTICLRTDEGRVASVVVTAVERGGGVEAEVTVWKWLGSQ